MQALRMAACGVLIALAFQSLIRAIIYPIMGEGIENIIYNSSTLGWQVMFLSTFYREECKEYWRIITRRPPGP